jgi:hypothetical protein
MTALRTWLPLAGIVVGLLALSALVWIAGPLLAVTDVRPLETGWSRALVIGVFVAIALGLAVLDWRRRREASAAIEAAMAASEEAEGDTPVPLSFEFDQLAIDAGVDQRHVVAVAALVASEQVEVGGVDLRRGGDERRLAVAGSRRACGQHGQRERQGGQGAALSAALTDVMCAWAAWVQSKAIVNSAPGASSSSSLTRCCLCRGWIGGLVFQGWRWRSWRAVQPMRRCDVCRVTSEELAVMPVAGSSGACVDDAAAEAAAAADRCLRFACWCAHVT